MCTLQVLLSISAMGYRPLKDVPLMQSVTICENCFSVNGPSSPSLAFFNQVDNSNSTYQLMLDWEPTYRGPITVDLQAGR